MTDKILRAILSVAAVVLAASFLISTGVLYQYFGNIQQEQLRDELGLAANGTEQLGEVYLDELKEAHYRITWIAEDGEVLFDNQVDVETMENHGDREEVKEALAYGNGSSSRYSTTLTEKNIYEAVRLKDGSILRVSESRVTILVLVLGMLQPIAVLILLILILSVWFANRMAKRIVEPLEQLDLDQPMENDVYEELVPLLRRIHAQQQEIKWQMQVLKQKQEEFDQITRNMKETLVLLDNHGRVLSMNPAAKVWFEIEDCEGMDFLGIDRKQIMRSAIEQAQKEGTASFYEEKNGREYQFELNSVESEGLVRGVVLLGFDVTEQVHAEQNRREFTANVSHELKTPLQSIIGSAELLENGIVQQEDIPRFVGHIREEAANLVCLIDDIIRLSQLDEGVELPQEDVSLKTLSEEVCKILSDAAKAKNISMEVVGDEGMIRGVRRLLYEIIYNLCDNAVKYSDIGGNVAVTIETEEDQVCLQVQDHGIGIATEDQEKVFERFYRVDKSHSKQSGGTGLGLSIVKHAVQCHQGKILLESALHEGTKITVQFPVDTASK